MKSYQDTIIGRKAFHTFKQFIPLTDLEVNEIKSYIQELKPIQNGIKFDVVLEKRMDENQKLGEYIIKIYSEIAKNYLQNVGYVGEQVELFLKERGIGTCWYGYGADDEKNEDDLNFIISINLAKVNEEEFRTSIDDFKRRNLNDLVKGDYYLDFVKLAGLAPSALNSEPWYFETSEHGIDLYQVKGTNPPVKFNLSKYNQIDIGIIVYFLDYILINENIKFEKIINEDFDFENGKNKFLTYIIKK